MNKRYLPPRAVICTTLLAISCVFSLQAEARFAINKARRSRIRTFLRKVEEAIASGNGEAAQAALKAAQPELARGVTKGVLHKNTVARKLSRLTRRVATL